MIDTSMTANGDSLATEGHPAGRIYIYKRYERFWHWSQALLVLTMLVSGFEVHGSYHLLGFEPAVRLHTLAAWALLTLWAFTIFWQFTTGEWRQYLPTHKKVLAMPQA
jgi:thiosulfate reductase cytochrome b subunit